jgi:hypothetical protein
MVQKVLIPVWLVASLCLAYLVQDTRGQSVGDCLGTVTNQANRTCYNDASTTACDMTCLQGHTKNVCFSESPNVCTVKTIATTYEAFLVFGGVCTNTDEIQNTNCKTCTPGTDGRGFVCITGHMYNTAPVAGTCTDPVCWFFTWKNTTQCYCGIG